MKLLSGLLPFVLALNCSSIGAESAPEQESNFVAAELIVKFAGSSRAGSAVADAMSGALTRDPGLSAYLEELSKWCGVPLEPAQLTSGSEVVLAIDRAELFEQVSNRLESAPRVESADERSPDKETLGPELTILVRFVEGSDDAALIAGPAAENKSTPELDALTKELSDVAGQPLVSRAVEEGALVLSVDLPLITRSLYQRLKEHPDVEYVQVNQVLQHF